LVTFVNGTGIAVTGTYPNFTITNSAPDVTLNLAAGTGMAVTGTYPSYTVTNSAPDQVVTISSSTPYITVSGTYPNFSIASSLLSPSFINATSSAASFAAGTSGSTWSTAFVKVSGSTDWSVDGSGGIVYSGVANGRALWFSLDYSQTSHTIGTGSNLRIIKNGSAYPVYTTVGAGFSWSAGAFVHSFIPSTPIVVEPGDVFSIQVIAATGGSITAPAFVWNVASAQ
jgi:hypothetical protein